MDTLERKIVQVNAVCRCEHCGYRFRSGDWPSLADGRTYCNQVRAKDHRRRVERDRRIIAGRVA